MPAIDINSITIQFPILHSSHRSLKKRVLSTATGGRMARDALNHAVVTAIDGLSLSVGSGERVALVGNNGSGKTTLLRVIAGVYAPTAGTIEVRGSVSSFLDIALGFDHEATGYENIYLRGLLMGLSRPEIDAVIDDIADFTELGEYLNIPVRAYSSGMLMRLAFAVATSVPRDILLMDEWLAVGDSDFAHKAAERLRTYVASSSILILATHSPDLVRALCSRRVCLSHGRIESDEKLDGAEISRPSPQ